MKKIIENLKKINKIMAGRIKKLNFKKIRPKIKI